jgi:type VI secretion system protein VasJ
MTIDYNILLQPISADHPAGEDCRMGSDFSAISGQIDKLTRASDVGQPDWPQIEALATQVLTQQSKDFLVAAWLSAAWLEKEGLTGIDAGLGLMNGLFDHFWEEGFPPVARIRGRRNAISWWIIKATAYLTTTTIPAIDQKLYDDLFQGATTLDKSIADKDPDAPSLGDFLRAIKNLTVLAPPPPPPSIMPSDPLTTPVTTDAPLDSPNQGSNTDSAVSSAQAALTPVGSKATPAQPSNLKSVSSINSIDDVEAALATVQPYINDVAQILTKQDAYNPLSVHLIRFAARAGIMSLPSADAGATLIPDPPPSEIQMLQSVSAGSSPEATIEFCEARITQYPFWLDLDYQSAQAYSALGDVAAGMHEAIIDEVLAFVKRLPGIEKLTFGGQKTPFASTATQSWLTDCANERSGGAVDDLALAKKNAMEQLGAGQLEAAIEIFQSFIDKTRSGRDQLRARIQLLEIMLGAKKEADLSSFVDPLLRECELRKIAEWEPSLALAAWSLKLHALRQAVKAVDPNTPTEKLSQYQNEIKEALREISMINYVDAAREL